MKITLFIREERHGWHIKQLEQASRENNNVELDIIDFKKGIYDINSLKSQLGDVILWRLASMNVADIRTSFLSTIKNKPIINQTVATKPLLSYKLYQQKTLESVLKKYFIPTYIFVSKNDLLEAIKSGILKYPFIQKPNLGSKGKGISLIKSEEEFFKQDIKIKDFIFQNFIKNTGDYRVFMLGGKVLGIIKRVGQEGNFLNNVSQGGTAIHITDEKILEQLRPIANNICSIFGLTMCGIDIIFDEDTQTYHFLEVNTVPQWKGFQTATGINVANEIINLCIDLHKRKSESTLQLVENYLSSNKNFLYFKNFHYFSRLYLWTQDQHAKEYLFTKKDWFVGKDDEAIRLKIKSLLENEKYDDEENPESSLRKKIRSKYKNLTHYRKVFLYWLNCQIIYNIDITKQVLEQINIDEIKSIRQSLLDNPKDIAILSTYAINFLYFIKDFFKDDQSFDFNPKIFLDIANNNYNIEDKKELRLQLYLISHCIIAESQFYSRLILSNNDVYIEMLKIMEKNIYHNYFKLSLDIKFEFLVCCQLCKYDSPLKCMINKEADNSLATQGNYLVDTLNANASFLNNSLLESEHRNILYIMANKQHYLS